MENKEIISTYLSKEITHWEWYFKLIEISTKENIESTVRLLKENNLYEEFRKIFIQLNYPTTIEGWEKMWIAYPTLHSLTEEEIKEKEKREILHLKITVPLFRKHMKIKEN